MMQPRTNALIRVSRSAKTGREFGMAKYPEFADATGVGGLHIGGAEAAFGTGGDVGAANRGGGGTANGGGGGGQVFNGSCDILSPSLLFVC